MSIRIAQVLGGLLLGTVVTLLWFAFTGLPASDRPPAGEDVLGGLVPDPYAVPALRGVDAAGDSLTTEAFEGRTTAVFFGYTSCPDVCPLTLARLGRYRAELPVERRDDLVVLFVSVDPSRDTPERIAQYVGALPGGVVGMTAEDIRAQARQWGVRAEDGDAFGDGAYLVDHTARTFVLDGEGRVVATLPPLPPSDRIAPLLDRLLGD